MNTRTDRDFLEYIAAFNFDPLTSQAARAAKILEKIIEEDKVALSWEELDSIAALYYKKGVMDVVSIISRYLRKEEILQ